MIPQYTIKRKGPLWKFAPLTGRNRFSMTFGSTIWLTPRRYDDYQKIVPKDSTLALIEHEKVHVEQWRQGPNFKTMYLTSRTHRLNYEAEAYSRQIYERFRLGTSRTLHYYLNRYAKILSSRTYLLFFPYSKVYRAIHREYDKWVAKLGDPLTRKKREQWKASRQNAKR